jgi:hypothetical protein
MSDGSSDALMKTSMTSLQQQENDGRSTAWIHRGTHPTEHRVRPLDHDFLADAWNADLR